jgi:phosphoenolpyruvate carboxykinase (GTP)
MGPNKDCIDIITELGGVTDLNAAQQVFKDTINAENLDKLKRIENPDVLKKIANAIMLCKPDAVFIDTGSEEDRQFVRELSLKKGEESPLPMPGHTIHFDLKEEQGRIIDRTFYIYNQGEEVNSLALKNDRADALEDIQQKMSGIMNGKTMMVGFFLRGPVGAPASNPALEISSSTYRWARRHPTRRLKYPARPMSCTAPPFSIAMYMPILIRKSKSSGISTPTSTAKA